MAHLNLWETQAIADAMAARVSPQAGSPQYFDIFSPQVGLQIESKRTRFECCARDSF